MEKGNTGTTAGRFAIFDAANAPPASQIEPGRLVLALLRPGADRRRARRRLVLRADEEQMRRKDPRLLAGLMSWEAGVAPSRRWRARATMVRLRAQ
jgi:hypothetical protein